MFRSQGASLTVKKIVGSKDALVAFSLLYLHFKLFVSLSVKRNSVSSFQAYQCCVQGLRHPWLFTGQGRKWWFSTTSGKPKRRRIALSKIQFLMLIGLPTVWGHHGNISLHMIFLQWSWRDENCRKESTGDEELPDSLHRQSSSHLHSSTFPVTLTCFQTSRKLQRGCRPFIIFALVTFSNVFQSPLGLSWQGCFTVATYFMTQYCLSFWQSLRRYAARETHFISLSQ